MKRTFSLLCFIFAPVNFFTNQLFTIGTFLQNLNKHYNYEITLFFQAFSDAFCGAIMRYVCPKPRHGQKNALIYVHQAGNKHGSRL